MTCQPRRQPRLVLHRHRSIARVNLLGTLLRNLDPRRRRLPPSHLSLVRPPPTATPSTRPQARLVMSGRPLQGELTKNTVFEPLRRQTAASSAGSSTHQRDHLARKFPQRVPARAANLIATTRRRHARRHFAYFGAARDSPLPITLAYVRGSRRPPINATSPRVHLATSAPPFVNALFTRNAQRRPSPRALQRGRPPRHALAAGSRRTSFRVNPDVPRAFVVDNAAPVC